MRRTVAVLAAGALLLGLTGCGMTDEELMQKRDYCVAHGGAFQQGWDLFSGDPVGWCDFSTDGN